MGDDSLNDSIYLVGSNGGNHLSSDNEWPFQTILIHNLFAVQSPIDSNDILS